MCLHRALDSFPAPAESVSSTSEDHDHPRRPAFRPYFADDLLRQALVEADRAQHEGALPIGTVLADASGSIIARARAGTTPERRFLRHAPVECFHVALREHGRLPRRGVLVTTVEPCLHCYAAAVSLGIGHVIFGLEWPARSGIHRIYAPEQAPTVRAGVLREECRQRLLAWAKAHPDDPIVASVPPSARPDGSGDMGLEG